MNVQTTTQNRKVLAEHLARLIGEPVRYLGVPSCAYQVGPYRINQDGSIDGEDLDPIHSFLAENGYIRETIGTMPEAEPEAPNQVEEPQSEADSETDAFTETHVSIPLTDYTPQMLTCLLKILYTRQKLVAAMTKSDLIHIDEELIDRLKDENPDTSEKIQQILDNEIAANMVTGIRIYEGKLEMAFPYDRSKPTEWQACANLMMALAKRGKTAHHMSGTLLDPTVDEMKYFCRNWLIQLGMGGPEHKENRRVLLGHLKGFAAFRTADKMQEHRDRYAAKRQEKREAKRIQEQEVTSND